MHEIEVVALEGAEQPQVARWDSEAEAMGKRKCEHLNCEELAIVFVIRRDFPLVASD